jgi:hypothetical protein
VWDLELGAYLRMRAEARAWLDHQKKQQDEANRRKRVSRAR